MTVSTTANRIDYTGNGSVTNYAYPFKIFEDTDLLVYVVGILQTLGAGYTVSGAGVDGGGNVAFVTAPTGAIAIIREVAETQLVDYVPNDSFPAETHEAALDRLTMISQQIDEKFGRSLQLSEFSTQNDKLVDDLVAAKFLRVKADLSGIEMADIAELGDIGIPVSAAQGGTGRSDFTSVAGVVAAVDLATGLSAAIAPTTLFTPLVDGFYRVNWTALVTVPAGTTSTLGGSNGLVVNFADPDDGMVSHSPVAGAPTAGQDKAYSQTNQGNDTTAQISGCICIYAKAGVGIQYSMDYTSNPAAAMRYNLHIRLEFLG